VRLLSPKRLLSPEASIKAFTVTNLLSSMVCGDSIRRLHQLQWAEAATRFEQKIRSQTVAMYRAKPHRRRYWAALTSQHAVTVGACRLDPCLSPRRPILILSSDPPKNNKATAVHNGWMAHSAECPVKQLMRHPTHSRLRVDCIQQTPLHWVTLTITS